MWQTHHKIFNAIVQIADEHYRQILSAFRMKPMHKTMILYQQDML